MIHYHGTPITPVKAAISVLQARHAMVSFANPEQMVVVAEVCQSFALDNGAFSLWKSGITPDWEKYYNWLGIWLRHPACDFAIIPDVIEGTEEENDWLIDQWFSHNLLWSNGVPVWHLHESLQRLKRLTRFPRIALGSSGDFSVVGNRKWWNRMAEAMDVLCDESGIPKCKLHGLRMLDPTVYSNFPFASADSASVALNIGFDTKWDHPYAALSKATRALVLAERFERHASAAFWDRHVGIQEDFLLQKNFALVG